MSPARALVLSSAMAILASAHETETLIVIGHEHSLSWWFFGGVIAFVLIVLGLLYCMGTDGHYSYHHGHRAYTKHGSHHHHRRSGGSGGVAGIISTPVGVPAFN